MVADGISGSSMMGQPENDIRRPVAALGVTEASLPPGPVQRALDDFDYLRFTCGDMHGIPRSKVAPRRRFREYMDKGINVFAGSMCYSTTMSEMFICTQLKDTNFGNIVMRPMLETLHALPWAAGGRYRVGEVLCETAWLAPYRDGAPQAVCPRYVARNQLDRLAQLGYQLLSGYEAEFVIFRGSCDDPGATMQPLFTQRNDMSTLVLAEHEPLLYTMVEQLSGAGVPVDAFHVEYDEGQFELVITPEYGVESADRMFTVKEAVKEICTQQGLTATFMTIPNGWSHDYSVTSLHFSHSLWKTDASGTLRNVLHDPTDAMGFSAVGRHWVAGLLRHAGAMTALCNPTVNCYRRIGTNTTFNPVLATWGRQDRATMVRVKCEGGEKQAFVENRLAGSAANPYLILAATVAAGIDGLVNELECPLESSELDSQAAAKLPTSLSDALDALQADKVMVQALGEELITLFTGLKREEIARAASAFETGRIFNVEHEMYFKWV